MSDFVNTPVLDFRRPAVRDQVGAALADLDRRLPIAAPVRIGERIRHGEELVSVDPGGPTGPVAVAAVASADEVDRAVTLAAGCGQGGWGARTAAERAAVLERAAGILAGAAARARRDGRARVREAVAGGRRRRLRGDRLPPLLRAAGGRARPRRAGHEHPRGVESDGLPAARRRRRDRAVELPGGDPLRNDRRRARGRQLRGHQARRAVAGMRRAARRGPARGRRASRGRSRVVHGEAATGNGARRASARRARSPSPGRSPSGAEIIERAGRLAPGQNHFKRVLAELGGKNCAFVDGDADLDDAIPALMAGAFGFAGPEVLGDLADPRRRGPPRRARRADGRGRRGAQRRTGGAPRDRRAAADRSRREGAARARRRAGRGGGEGAGEGRRPRRRERMVRRSDPRRRTAAAPRRCSAPSCSAR